MRTEAEIKNYINKYNELYLNALKTYDTPRKHDIERSLATLYWVLDKPYVLPSPVDKTTVYNKIKRLGPQQMAKFFNIDEICLTREITTDEWVKLLKQKGVR